MHHNSMNNDLMARYEAAILAKRRAELEVELLRAEALEYVRKQGKSENDGKRVRLVGNNGQFFISQYKTYVFSPAVDEAIKAVKKLKQKEIDDKIAQLSSREVFMFKSL